MKTHWLRVGCLGGGYQDYSMSAFISHKHNNDKGQTPRNPERLKPRSENHCAKVIASQLHKLKILVSAI